METEDEEGQCEKQDLVFEISVTMMRLISFVSVWRIGLHALL